MAVGLAAAAAPVDERALAAEEATSRAAHRDAAAEESPVAAILVTDSMRVLEAVRLARKVRLDRRFQLGPIVVVDAIDPFRHCADAPGP